MNICFLGNSATGKSHIVHSLRNSNEIYYPVLTLAIDYSFYNYNNNKIFIWDCTGSKKIFCIIKTFLPNIDMVLIVCNIYDINSINDIDFYINTINNPYHIIVNTCNYLKSSYSGEKNRLLLENKYPNQYTLLNSSDPNDVTKKIKVILNKI